LVDELSFKHDVDELQKYVVVPSSRTKPLPDVENFTFGGDCSRVMVCLVPLDVEVQVALNVASLPELAFPVSAWSFWRADEVFFTVVVVVFDELDPHAASTVPPSSTAATARA
jgi:hypothetical protein